MMRQQGNFKPFTEKGWMVFADKTSWHTKRIIGFMEVKDNEDSEWYWCPAYIEGTVIEVPHLDTDFIVVFGREPIEDDGIDVMTGNVDGTPMGTFSKKALKKIKARNEALDRRPADG